MAIHFKDDPVCVLEALIAQGEFSPTGRAAVDAAIVEIKRLRREQSEAFNKGYASGVSQSPL